MAELKTKKSNASVKDFVDAIDDEQKRKDVKVVAKIMKAATKKMPKLWGASIVGYGAFTIDYANGKTGEWFQVGYSPRKANLTVYLLDGFAGHDEILSRLGKHKIGKSCLYIKRLSDVDVDVLEELVKKSVEYCEAKQAARD